VMYYRKLTCSSKLETVRSLVDPAGGDYIRHLLTRHRRADTVCGIRLAVVLACLLYVSLLLLTAVRGGGHLKSVHQSSMMNVVFHGPLKSSAELAEEEATPVTDDELLMLINLFRRADFDKSEYLSMSEIEVEIGKKVRNHLMNAMRGNFKHFFSLDKQTKNGQIEWSEYLNYYLSEWLQLDSQTTKLVHRNSPSLPRNIKEAISRLKAAWSEVAHTNPEALNIDEFLSLEHPESSMPTIMAEVDIIMLKHDLNGDGVLTKTEYINDPFIDASAEEQQQRELEFTAGIDKNFDGIANRRELISFCDPRNKFWWRQEAAKLMAEADTDHNNKLSLEELLSRPVLFLDSKFFDAVQVFHPGL